MTFHEYSPERWKRIESLFDQVADLPIDQQQPELYRLVGDDEELRSDVESLLAHHSAPDREERSRVVPESGGNQWSIGDRVGRYQLERLIAVSRSAEVWQAVSTKPSAPNERPVAIKFLRAVACDRVRVERFRREIGILELLEHPGIAKLITHGEARDVPYLVMRYVDGSDILHYADTEQLGLFERLTLALTVMDAVAYAQRHNVIHRDLKPSNILVDSGGDTKVVDFGISRFHGDERGVALGQDLTRTQERPMTPGYASPEQFVGRAVTPASDVYSMGVILYQLVTGHHPYSSVAIARTSGNAVDMIDRARWCTPRPPSEVVGKQALRKTAGDTRGALDQPRRPPPAVSCSTKNVPSAASRATEMRRLKRVLRRYFDAAVLKSLAKDPQQRFASIDEFRSVLVLACQRARDGSSPPELGPRGPAAFLTRTATAIVILTVGMALGKWARMPGDSATVADGKRLEGLSQSTTVADSEAGPPPFGTAGGEWRDHMWRVIESLPEQQALQQHSDTLTALSQGHPLEACIRSLAAGRMETAAFFARSLPRSGASLDAIIEEDPTARWSVARVSAALRRPTQGSIALGLLDASFLKADEAGKLEWVIQRGGTRDALEPLVRILIDVGMPEQALQCSTLFSSAHATVSEHLLQVEARYASGWHDGAREMIESLQAREAEMSLSEAARFAIQRAQLEEPDRRIESLRPWTDVADASEWQPAMLQVEALLGAAAADRSRANLEEAEHRLQRASNIIQRWNQQHSVLAYRVAEARIQLYFDTQRALQAHELAATIWSESSVVGELACDRLMWIAALLPDDLPAAERSQVWPRLQDQRAICVAKPHLHRMLLRQHAFALLELERYEPARDALVELLPMDVALMGQDELFAAQSRAALARAEQQLGNGERAEQYRQQVLTFVERQASDGAPAYRFLLPIRETSRDENPYPNHKWLHLCSLYRHNPVDDQMQMVLHYARQLQETHPKIARMLRGD